jgi:hypothetical protein
MIGAASWVFTCEGLTCDPSFPAAYAFTVTYRDWIIGKVNDPSWKP